MDNTVHLTTYGNLNLPEGTDERPLVTFALFAYNQEKYIREAVEGAFSQTYSPLEIILSDDCSSDHTFEIMSQLAESYIGDHRVVLRQNADNIGLGSHFNEVIATSSGSIIVVAAGDDVSLPDRSERSVQLFIEHPDVSALCSSALTIDEFGATTGTKKLVAQTRPFIKFNIAEISQVKTLGASRAFRRILHDRFGPLNADCPTEDTPLLLRSLLSGHVLNVSTPTVLYRVHGSNLSGPRLIHKVSSSAIERQYKTDLATLSSAGELSKSTARICLQWISENNNIRLVRGSIVSHSKISLFPFMRFLFIPRISWREKCGAIRHHFVRLIRTSVESSS